MVRKICLSPLLFLLAVMPCRTSRAGEPSPEDEGISSETSVVELITAEREIKERLGLDPGNADLYFQLSNVYAELFDRTRKKSSESNSWLMKSGSALEKTVMIRPDHAVAHYNLGVVHKRLGRMERAREELKKAIRVSDPAEDGYFLAACWMQIGEIYAEQKFFDEAEDAFEKALEYDYGSDEIRASLEDIKDAKKQAGGGGAFPDVGATLPFASSGTARNTAVDPYTVGSSDNQVGGAGAVAQALPYLGQMLSQKFSGGGGNQDDSGVS